MAHFSVKHRSPFRKSFIPSRRHKRQTASRCLAKALSPFLKLPNLFACYTRRRFGGRQPLCGTGVTSLIALICKPEDASARTADSRPAPGPFTRPSPDFIPYWSRATPAAVAAACCAAYGVPLREPLNPTEPADDQLTARPSGSVSVMMVLLNVAWRQTTPCGTTRFSRFLRNSFLRLDGFADAGAADASTRSFAISFALSRSQNTDVSQRLRAYLRAAVFFLAATAPLRGPLRVRALVWVRCPRTGRLRRCRNPR